MANEMTLAELISLHKDTVDDIKEFLFLAYHDAGCIARVPKNGQETDCLVIELTPEGRAVLEGFNVAFNSMHEALDKQKQTPVTSIIGASAGTTQKPNFEQHIVSPIVVH
jgi:hypothetical protein